MPLKLQRQKLRDHTTMHDRKIDIMTESMNEPQNQFQQNSKAWKPTS